MCIIVCCRCCNKIRITVMITLSHFALEMINKDMSKYTHSTKGEAHKHCNYQSV
jgi:hypothetical protein